MPDLTGGRPGFFPDCLFPEGIPLSAAGTAPQGRKNKNQQNPGNPVLVPSFQAGHVILQAFHVPDPGLTEKILHNARNHADSDGGIHAGERGRQERPQDRQGVPQSNQRSQGGQGSVRENPDKQHPQADLHARRHEADRDDTEDQSGDDPGQNLTAQLPGGKLRNFTQIVAYFFVPGKLGGNDLRPTPDFPAPGQLRPLLRKRPCGCSPGYGRRSGAVSPSSLPIQDSSRGGRPAGIPSLPPL